MPAAVSTIRPNLSRAQAACVANAALRLETMRGYRIPWWSHWALLAEQFLPRRYRWFVQPNNYARGSPLNASIVDETGMLAARVLSTALLSGLTSPTRPWFSWGLSGVDEIPQGAVQSWLAECTKRHQMALGGSNFYTAWGQCLYDKVVFGSSALIQYEDFSDVFSFYYPCLGEFFNGLDGKNNVDTLAREFTFTAAQVVKKFGLDNVSPSTKGMYVNPSGKDTEIVCAHMIEPNDIVYEGGAALGYPVPKKFAYREVYWERQSAQGTQQGHHLLRIRGFNEKPFTAPMWDQTSNDAYGRSPGMDALPATRQSQVQVRRQAEAIDKLVRPPMVGSVAMKNEPASILPGGITYTPDPKADGFKPAFTVEPRLSEFNEVLEALRARIQRIFFNDVVAPISGLVTVRTATEIENRVQEALVQIGPVIERTQNELSDILSRGFSIMARRGLFPPAPPEIQGRELEVKYVSMFAETQRAAVTTAIERLYAFVGGLVGVKPDVVDNLNFDRSVEEYAAALNVDPTLVNDIKAIAVIRAQRQQQEQAAAALQTGAAAAQGAQTLSQTDVGGGQNALQMMLGRGSAAA